MRISPKAAHMSGEAGKDQSGKVNVTPHLWQTVSTNPGPSPAGPDPSTSPLLWVPVSAPTGPQELGRVKGPSCLSQELSVGDSGTRVGGVGASPVGHVVEVLRELGQVGALLLVLFFSPKQNLRDLKEEAG